MKNYSEYTVKLSSEPSYYGSDVTAAGAAEIVKSLGSLIQSEFPGIQIEDYTDGRGSSATTGPDSDTVDQINDWIANNWTAAL